MVLESLFSADKLEKKPYKIIIATGLYITIACIATILLSKFFEPQVLSTLFVLLVAFPALPQILAIMTLTEIEVEQQIMGSSTFGRNYNLITTLMLMFFGLILFFTIAYILLPQSHVEKIFTLQIKEVQTISNIFTGHFTYNSQNSFEKAFEQIFFHNTWVLLSMFLLSAIYGAGSVIALAWNASVISVFLANAGLSLMTNSNDTTGLVTGITGGFLGILPHGIFELIGYCCAVLVGGMISVIIVRKAYNKPVFFTITKDIAKIAAISVIAIAIGALIEAYAIAT